MINLEKSEYYVKKYFYKKCVSHFNVRYTNVVTIPLLKSTMLDHVSQRSFGLVSSEAIFRSPRLTK